MSRPVIYIVRSWPRLSQTFVLNEVLALERRGVDLAIFSLVHSHEATVQPHVRDVRAHVRYLDGRRSGRRNALQHLRLLIGSPVAYARALALCVRRPELAAGYGDCSALQCFDLAAQVAHHALTMRSSGADPVHVHAHFAHDPALVGMLAARLTGLPFTFTAHARDLVQIPVGALAARAAEAEAVVTCCAVNAEYIASVVPEAQRPPVMVIHHGVDVERFAPRHREPTGSTRHLVSIGRLVPKKGFDDLLHALRAVKDAGGRFRCDIYGDGPEDGELLRLRDRLELTDEVEFRGAQDGDRIVAALTSADLFVLTPRVAADGDRDGIPNVLVEAMSTGLPVVTTTAGGVTELVEAGRNGVVTEPGDVAGLARLITELLDDADQRRRLGAAARATVERSYDVNAAAGQLERLMRPNGVRAGKAAS
jgi:glycosyltransferase involved in cell wall biosynthesis